MKSFEMQEAYGAVDVQGTLEMTRPGIISQSYHESRWPEYRLKPETVKVTIYDDIAGKDHDITNLYLDNPMNFRKLEQFLIEMKNKDEAA